MRSIRCVLLVALAASPARRGGAAGTWCGRWGRWRRGTWCGSPPTGWGSRCSWSWRRGCGRRRGGWWRCWPTRRRTGGRCRRSCGPDLVRSGPGTGAGRRRGWWPGSWRSPCGTWRGQLWLRPRADGATLELAGGDLAPGRFQLRWCRPRAGAPCSCGAGRTCSNANWITRRLAARHAHAEPAMAGPPPTCCCGRWCWRRSGAAAVPAARRRAGRAPPLRAPELAELDGRPLAAALAQLRPLAAGEPRWPPCRAGPTDACAGRSWRCAPRCPSSAAGRRWPSRRPGRRCRAGARSRRGPAATGAGRWLLGGGRRLPVRGLRRAVVGDAAAAFSRGRPGRRLAGRGHGLGPAARRGRPARVPGGASPATRAWTRPGTCRAS